MKLNLELIFLILFVSIGLVFLYSSYAFMVTAQTNADRGLGFYYSLIGTIVLVVAAFWYKLNKKKGSVI